MKRIIFLGLFALLILTFLITPDSYAAGDAETYKMTVQRVQLKNDATDTWVTISTPNRELDIAAVNAGAVAGTLVGDSTIPVGNYDNFKMVISETLSFSGADGTNYSKSGGTITVTGSDANAASTATWGGALPNSTFTESVESHTAVAGEQGEVSVTLDLDAGDADNYFEVYLQNDLTNTINITANSKVTMSFDFDTQGTINYINAGGAVGNAMFFSPPQEGTEFVITVDSTSTTISESQMRTDF